MSRGQADFGVLNVCHSDVFTESMADAYPGVHMIPTDQQHALQYFTSTHFCVSVDSIQPMDIANDGGQSIDIEPVRLISGIAPPKRFYRTFWRSAARRILAVKEEQQESH